MPARASDAEASATAAQGFPAREQLGVLEFEVLHRHGRKSGHGASFGSDLPRPADRAGPRLRVPGSLGPARRPCGAGPEPDVRFSAYILFGHHRTVPFTPG